MAKKKQDKNVFVFIEDHETVYDCSHISFEAGDEVDGPLADHLNESGAPLAPKSEIKKASR